MLLLVLHPRGTLLCPLHDTQFLKKDISLSVTHVPTLILFLPGQEPIEGIGIDPAECVEEQCFGHSIASKERFYFCHDLRTGVVHDNGVVSSYIGGEYAVDEFDGFVFRLGFGEFSCIILIATALGLLLESGFRSSNGITFCLSFLLRRFLLRFLLFMLDPFQQSRGRPVRSILDRGPLVLVRFGIHKPTKRISAHAYGFDDGYLGRPIRGLLVVDVALEFV
eukprot:CAMPEP_0172518100 /NCGR_PEP_ID=MMETSP1066-20121228/290424_1 /TAXON_ID=671091 /ORGANISM="Coscinodiscus wailesii, Strain CCMP2513" /LENGTH=221 /DNA_ID=CAMNT_0013300409 /DNA_START=171 /DNA_END=833 /DNA_ORIENTATION=-